MSGVVPAVSPKSYSRLPAVRLGQAAGSAATRAARFASVQPVSPAGTETRDPRNCCHRRGMPMTMSGNSPASSICFLASWPMIVWCISTWFSTLPREYLVSSRLAASSIASEIAIPRLPGESGVSGEYLSTRLGQVRWAGDHLRAVGLHHDSAVRLLVVAHLTM